MHLTVHFTFTSEQPKIFLYYHHIRYLNKYELHDNAFLLWDLFEGISLNLPPSLSKDECRNQLVIEDI